MDAPIEKVERNQKRSTTHENSKKERLAFNIVFSAFQSETMKIQELKPSYNKMY
jgi:hypothetical protein